LGSAKRGSRRNLYFLDTDSAEFVMSDASLVAIIDDDVSVRQSLPDMVRQFGFRVRAFTSAEEFLASDCVGQTKCLVLDVSMPGMSGPDLQRELTRRGRKIPIVFITGQADDALRQQLIANGAAECLFKPFNAMALLKALNIALK
jgi:FixJ family two-component response regulator